MAPAFCQDAQTFNGWSQGYRESPRSAYWVSQMGPAFWGIHHYCWAVISTRRANAPGVTPLVRNHLLGTAINDYMYVLNNATAEFPLVPEIYYQIGEVHIMLGQYANAINAFNLSRKAKVDYWPPYVSEAKVLEKLNKRTEARAMILQGLQVMPQEPVLLEHFRRLGGSPSAIPKAPTRPASPPSATGASSAPR